MNMKNVNNEVSILMMKTLTPIYVTRSGENMESDAIFLKTWTRLTRHGENLDTDASHNKI